MKITLIAAVCRAIISMHNRDIQAELNLWHTGNKSDSYALKKRWG